jgi:hypothetical protein
MISWSLCGLRIFMFPLQMIIYLLIELEPTGKFNYKSDLFIYQKSNDKFWTNWVLEFSGIFFAKF